MSISWTVLYDVTRHGVGVFPTLPFLVGWIGGDAAAAWSLRTREARRRAPWPLWIWLVAWNGVWGYFFSMGLAGYIHNRSALASGNVKILEGEITEFHRQDPSKKGDLERLTIAEHTFQYSDAMLGYGGMRSSQDFTPPLQPGLYVRVYYRDGTILKLEARQSATP